MNDKKLTPLDFIKDISQFKKNILNEDNEKQYNSYLINRFLSMDATTILYAAEINIRPNMSKRMQYDYYLNAIEKRNRFFKYVKDVDDENLAVVKEYFGYGKRKAKDALLLLTPEDIEYIKARLNKGGKNAKQK